MVQTCFNINALLTCRAQHIWLLRLLIAEKRWVNFKHNLYMYVHGTLDGAYMYMYVPSCHCRRIAGRLGLHYPSLKTAPVLKPRFWISFCLLKWNIRQKKNCYVALSRPTVKCEKTGSGFFFYFFFLCQIWAKNLLKFVFNGLKKHLYICVLTAFRPSFPHLET